MTTFQPGDTVLVLAGVNMGVRAIFVKYDEKNKAVCKGPGSRIHRIRVKPEKLKLIKRGGKQ